MKYISLTRTDLRACSLLAFISSFSLGAAFGGFFDKLWNEKR